MYSKHSIRADHSHTHKSISENKYRISHIEYHHIKQWLSLSTKRQFQHNQETNALMNPTNNKLYNKNTTNASNIGTNQILIYVFSFKAIELNDNFISANYRIINNIDPNGLIAMANIFDQAKSYYVTESFEKKGISCIFQESTKTLQLSQPLIMSFYIKNNNNAPLSGLNYLINLQIASTYSTTDSSCEVLELGTVQYDLSHRPKHAIRDYPLNKHSQHKIGIIQFTIDCPDEKLLPLMHLIPPYRIINQSTQLPPCDKVQLQNKLTPLTISQKNYYPINIEQLVIIINSHTQLQLDLKKNSTFFMDFHYEAINVEILEYQILIGFHNSWMFVKNLGNLLNADNKSYQQNKKPKSPSKNSPKAQGRQKQNYSLQISKFIKLDSQLSGEQITLVPINQLKKSIQLHYFHSCIGQLALILQVKVKYILNLTIKEEKTEIVNLGWSPILFTPDEENSSVELNIINNQLKFPGYTTTKNNCQIKLSYEAKNLNQKLHQIARKQAQKAMNYDQIVRPSTLKSISSDDIQDEYTNKLKIDIQDEFDGKLGESQKHILNKLHKKQLKVHNSLSQESNEKQISNCEKVHRLITILNKKLKPRLHPNGLQIPIPPEDTMLFPSKAQLLHKTVHLTIQFQSILPHIASKTDENSQNQSSVQINNNYYVPRKMLIEIFLLRHHYSFVAELNSSKNSIKYCIPLQFSCSKIVEHGLSNTVFNQGKNNIQWNIKSIQNNKLKTELSLEFTIQSEQKYNEILQASMICQVYDFESYLLYGSGLYPSISILKQSKETINNGTRSLLLEQFKRFKSNNESSSQNIRINLESNPSQQKLGTISKAYMDTIHHPQPKNNFQEENENNSKHFRVELSPPGNCNQFQKQSQIFGSLLFSASCTLRDCQDIKNEGESKNKVVEECNIQKIVPGLSTKQRQLLRIHNYNQIAQSDKHELISKYKQDTHRKLIDKIIKQQYNNDIVIDYETGISMYEWLPFINNDTSGNDLFTFQFDHDVLQLVVDPQEYQQQANKTMANLQISDTYQNPQINYCYSQKMEGQTVTNKYESRIPYKKEYKLLLKCHHQQWQPFSGDDQKEIILLSVKRNKQSYTKYKILLKYRKPLVDSCWHLTLKDSSNVKIPIPKQLLLKYSDFIRTLTKNTSYSSKQKAITLSEENGKNFQNLKNDDYSEYFSDYGRIVDILIGFYWDKKCENIMRTVILRVQLLEAQQIVLELGQLYQLRIPYCIDKMEVSDKIYRIETSNNDMVFNYANTYKILSTTSIHSQSKNQSTQQLELTMLNTTSEPQLSICCLKPSQGFSQNLIINIINVDGQLVKKYLLNFKCKISHAQPINYIRMNGYKEERSVIMFKNPYKIDFGFYFKSTISHLITLFELGSREELTNHQFPLKIRANSHLKIAVQLKSQIQGNRNFSTFQVTPSYLTGNQKVNNDVVVASDQVQRQEYGALLDCNYHVVAVYKFAFVCKVQQQNYHIHKTDKIMTKGRDQLISLFGPQGQERNLSI